ncbi:hypothetical protein NIE88_07015 [Sporolactobacillus shoreicorticis]|uniref:Lipoprotein n=1 Tax=Sporolactobacillus shoreicorticis TaxID=1923877 RepID=A0ABW5SA45_9BACL|nr:hypothetical protein [Sporolactobacillus shoreicorticis]MCO7125520.1 hypothetical protein [Sporolactobacillus shoreicorticis]
MKSGLPKWAVFVSLFLFVVGCSNGDTASSERKNGENTTSVSPKDTGKSEDTSPHDIKREETIRTVLKGIVTGPDEEQKKLFKKQTTEDPQAMYPYLEKKYKFFLDEQYLQEFLKNNQATTWLQTAFMAGYQLKAATPIKIQKAKSGGYTFEFDVDYSKNGETNTVTIIGDTSTNDDDKITAINIIDDQGLFKLLTQKVPARHEK